MQPRIEPMHFTDRIKALQTLLEKIQSPRQDELMARLRKLRTYSDIGEIIGHPKNDNVKIGGTMEAIQEAQTDPQSLGAKMYAREHTQYHDFRAAFSDVQHDVVEEVRRATGHDFSRDLRDIFSSNDQKKLSDIYARLDSGQFRQTL